MKLTLTQFVTLDGVHQSPGTPDEDSGDGFTQGGWVRPFFEEQLDAYVGSIFDRADGFLLGRTTYDIFAAFWPKLTDPADPIASRLNGLPKYVASRTLASADWANSTVLDGDVVQAVARLKEQPGRELQMHGSAGLAQTLFDAGLIDTIHLMVFPVVLGSGRRLFADGRTPSRFRVSGVRTTPTGVTMQTLDLDGAPEYASMAD